MVYKSTNAAVSWTSSSAFSNRAIKTCQANVNRVYTASVGFGVFRSDDGGTSWSNIQDNGLPSGSITDVNVCPSIFPPLTYWLPALNLLALNFVS